MRRRSRRSRWTKANCSGARNDHHSHLTHGPCFAGAVRGIRVSSIIRRSLNRIAAHLTLFHTLPATDAVRDVLVEETAKLQAFSMRVTAVRSLGRGVAFRLESVDLSALHGRLAKRFAEYLSTQDRQKFQPHVVVQNKVSGAEAKALLAELSAGFVPYEVEAVELEWWDYLGGPWQLRERLGFVRGRS